MVRRSVPDADLPNAVRRTGAAPEHRTVTRDGFAAAVAQAVTELTESVDGTVGVIAPTHRRDAVAKWVAESTPEAARSRVQVVDGMRAKGMEYDGVVILAPDEIEAESPAGIRVLYVALTRATHHLITIAPTPAWRQL
jgi:DNA helicase IV